MAVGVEGTGMFSVHQQNSVFETSDVFTHIYIVFLDMEDHSERVVWEFQGRHIGSELYINSNA